MINPSEITILVRGKIEKDTPVVLKNLHELFKGSKIILSTWKNSEVSDLFFDVLVENDDPGAEVCNAPKNAIFDKNGNAIFTINGKKYCNKPKTNSVNRIIKSLQRGLENVETKYTLSIRTDIILKNRNFLNYWDKFPIRNNEYKIFNHRIINNSTFAQFAHIMKDGIQLLPFHMSDWIHFGLTEDIKLLYSCPFQDTDSSGQYWYKHTREQYDPYPDAGWQYPPETYVLYSLVKQKFPEIKFKNSNDYNAENMSFSNKIIANNFIMIDDDDFKFSLKKYPQIVNWQPELYNGFITYREWQNLYKTYCNENYKFCDTDFKRLPYYRRLLNPVYFLKYPGKYLKMFKDIKHIFNKNYLRNKFYIGETNACK